MNHARLALPRSTACSDDAGMGMAAYPLTLPARPGLGPADAFAISAITLDWHGVLPGIYFGCVG